MQIKNKFKKIREKAQPYLFASIMAPLAACGIYCYAQAMKIESHDVGQMQNLIKNSPRREYIIQKGDSLDNLRNKFFPIKNEEFKGLDSKIFYYNQENGVGQRHWEEGYKGLTADNTWTQIVRKENKLPLIDCLFKSLYYVQEGKKIYVPVRETH